MRYTHFPTPWDERCSSRAGTLLYGFNQQLTNPYFLLLRRSKRCEPPKTPLFSREAGKRCEPPKTPLFSSTT